MKIADVYIDASGRIVLPKKARELCQISPNEPLEVLVEGCRIIIQPAKALGEIIAVDGVEVFSGAGSFLAQDVIEQSRLERDDSVAHQLWAVNEQKQQYASGSKSRKKSVKPGFRKKRKLKKD